MFVLEIILRTDKEKPFKILPKSWFVERTFSWFDSYRRLGKDYGYHIDTAEAMVQIAMIKRILNRIKEKF